MHQFKENIDPNTQISKNRPVLKKAERVRPIRNIALLLQQREMRPHRIVEDVLRYETPFKKLRHVVCTLQSNLN